MAFKVKEQTLETINNDMVRVYCAREMLDELFRLQTTEDKWYQARLGYFLHISMITYFETILIILCRLYDENSKKSLAKAVEYFKNNGSIQKLLSTTLDLSEKQKLDEKYFTKKSSENLYMYYQMIQEKYLNFSIGSSYKALRAEYNRLGLQQIRDKYLAHNDDNMSFLKSVNKNLYQQLDLKQFINDTNSFLQDLYLLAAFSTIDRHVHHTGKPVQEVLSIIDREVKKEIYDAREGLG